MRAEPRLLGSEEATVAKKGCSLRGSALRAHALCELGLSLPLRRAVWVAARIREGHRRKATTVSCMSSSHCFHWRTCLLFNEKHMEESAPLQNLEAMVLPTPHLVTTSSPPGRASSTACPSSRLHSGLTHHMWPLPAALAYTGLRFLTKYHLL